MNRRSDKSVSLRRFLFLSCFLILLGLGLWKVYGSLSLERHGYSYVFDGWVYGREDQKRASRALASSGLNDFHWKEGRLFVPGDKLVAYQSALATANALPKAPGEQREETMRNMSVFESESKARLRELNGCASQLERTIEQIRGVEFATVGVRSRREMNGFASKDVVTASVGIAFQDGRELDSNTLTAITLATKHHLGIDDSTNISIIDLKEGKSYLGVQPGNISEGQTFNLRKKGEIEKYWRQKYLEAFNDIKNLRVSVIAELGETESDERRSISFSINSRSSLIEGSVFASEISECCENQGSLERPFSEDSTSSLQLVQCSASRAREGNATLGNPVSLERRVTTSRISTKVSSSSTQTTSVSTQKVSGSSSRFNWLEKEPDSNNSYKPLTSLLEEACSAANENNNHSAQPTPSLDSMRPTPLAMDRGSGRDNSSKELSPLPAVVDDPVGSKEKHNPIRQVSASEKTRNSSQEEVLRAITICISVPQSYVDSISQKNRSADGDVSGNGDAATSKEAQEVLAGIKEFAIELFRPVGESLGWSETTIDNSFIVSSYLDTEFLPKQTPSSSEVDGIESSSAFLHRSIEDTPYIRTDLLPNAAYVDSQVQCSQMTTSEVFDPYGEKSEIQNSDDVVGEESTPVLQNDTPGVNQKFSIKEYWNNSALSSVLNRVKGISKIREILLSLLTLVIVFVGGFIWRRSARARQEHKVHPSHGENFSQRKKGERVARSTLRSEDPADISDEFDDQDEYLPANEKVDKTLLRKDLQNEQVNVVGNGNDTKSDNASVYWKRRQEALERINRKTLIHSN